MSGKRDSHSNTNVPGSDAFLSALRLATDRCVKCALCLPHCPTYALNPTETQSPRGRVSVVAGLASGMLEPDDARPSLDSCLSCRACEQVCPARVEYGSILDRGKMLLGPADHTERRASALLRRPLAVRLLGALWRATRALPLPRRLRRWQALPGTPTTSANAAPVIAPQDTLTGKPVTVLVGCLSTDFDGAAVDAFVQLFAALNRPCTLISGCCGALDQHSGASTQANAQGRQLLARIPNDDSPIVHLASGCAAAVSDLPHHSTSPDARTVSDRVVDPFALLYSMGIHDFLTADAKNVTKVALHLPCSQRNVLTAGTAMEALFASLAGVDAKALTGVGCCGAAGTHMLRDAQTASTMAGHVLRQVPPTADVLVSANLGCAWHLRGALFDREQTLPVEHPAIFLARRLAPNQC
ncbi:MAG: (Fe-S)-binding protein [Gammaproteobacteria bacterium]